LDVRDSTSPCNRKQQRHPPKTTTTTTTTEERKERKKKRKKEKKKNKKASVWATLQLDYEAGTEELREVIAHCSPSSSTVIKHSHTKENTIRRKQAPVRN